MEFLKRSKKISNSMITTTDRNSKTIIYNDRICITFNFYTSEYSSYINGEVTTGSGLRDHIDEIVRIRNQKPYKNAKLLIFINDLDKVKNLLPDGIDLYGHEEEEKGIKFVSYCDYETEKVIFRNFNRIANITVDECREFYPEKSDVESMASFLDSFEVKWTKINYSLAYMTKKMFYKPIRDELWNDMCENKIFFKKKSIYDAMFVGNKAGIFRKFESDYEKQFTWNIFYFVYSYDKKSAYPSKLVSDDKFPIGTISEIHNRKESELFKALKKDVWVKITIFPEKELPPEFEIFKSKNKLEYGLEYYDLKALLFVQEFPIDDFVSILRSVEWHLYKSSSTGYLNDNFRKRLIELYDRKNILPRNSIERFFIKTQLDMLYGKSIQDHKFETLQEINDHYKFRGDNYLLPQHGMHCVAAVRFEILIILYEYSVERNKFDPVIAYDTDGLKVRQGLNAPILKFNKLIHQKNLKAGFDSDIGEWDLEYIADRFLQFAPKVYCYETDGKMVYKLAGVHEDYLALFLDNLDEDFMEYAITNGLRIKTPNCYIYDKESNKFKVVLSWWKMERDERSDELRGINAKNAQRVARTA